MFSADKMNLQQSLSDFTLQLGDLLSEEMTLHQLFDELTLLLVKNFQARGGFYLPYWYEELALVSSQRFAESDALAPDDDEIDQACHQANQLFEAAPDELVLCSESDDAPLICIRLIDEGHPEMWLIFLLQKPLQADALSHVRRLVPWMEDAVVQCRRLSALQHAETRMDEMTRGMAETMAQLVQAEKMSELGKLTAGIAHEINNPIGYIRSNLETLVNYVDTFEKLFGIIHEWAQSKPGCSDMLKELEAEFDLAFLIEDAHDIVNTNLAGIDRIRDIVGDLYAFSRKGEGVMRPLSITDVIDRCIKLTHGRFDSNHAVVVNVETDQPYCMGDASQLEQVMVNLMINAVHAMPAGGTLSFDIRSTETKLVVRVKDTGTGMDKVTLQKIFSPFFTTKPTGVGTGLGLSISMGILQAHHATVSVDSEINKGTEFTISFPLYQPGKG